MGTFKPGESGNPEGRPKGAINKTSQQLRETITDFLTENFDKIKQDFHDLKPRERSRLYCDLLRYGLPQLQAISLDIELEKLTDAQLDSLFERIQQSALKERAERVGCSTNNDEDGQTFNERED